MSLENTGNWQEIKALGEKIAEAESNRVFLIEFKKSKKAMLMVEFEQQEPGAAIAKQERYAYSHPDYIEILHGLKVATEQAARYKFEMQVMEMRFETWRTQQATMRAEMNLR